MRRHNTVGKIMLKCVEIRASQLYMKRCIWLNLQAKVARFFFLSAYVTLLSTTGYKVLKYLSRIHMVYLAAQQLNKLLQFLVCANVGMLFTLDILSQVCEKHIQTRFSLQQFWFWSITQPIMLCHVSVHSCPFCLRHRAGDPISVAFFDRVALFSDFN